MYGTKNAAHAFAVLQFLLSWREIDIYLLQGKSKRYSLYSLESKQVSHFFNFLPHCLKLRLYELENALCTVLFPV